ncbi:hypothetical protein [Methylomonas sp. CM2]|uniref:hypothetical protein n=1 Tax=Methylomonas sp. CM2 TaxID=3417647 RepID=UPI003CF0F524
MSKKIIIWLEDKPELNQKVEEILKTKFELVICNNLKQFGDAVNRYSSTPELVAGFVLDVLIETEDLSDLDMPLITTNKGHDTGERVLRNYIRNADGDSPQQDLWRQHKVLMLTSLSKLYFNSHYRNIIESQNNNGDHTVWLSKIDKDGGKVEAEKNIIYWTKSL